MNFIVTNKKTEAKYGVGSPEGERTLAALSAGQ